MQGLSVYGSEGRYGGTFRGYPLAGRVGVAERIEWEILMI